jgi:hypothetical protein
MCIKFLKEKGNKCDCPVSSEPKLNLNKIKFFINNNFKIFDSITLDREITTEIISNNLNNIPLKLIYQPSLFSSLQFNTFYYNIIRKLNKDGKNKVLCI